MSVSDVALAERIEAIRAELEPLQKAAAEAFWQLNITGEDHWQEESARLSTEIRVVLSRPEPYDFLKRAVAEANGRIRCCGARRCCSGTRTRRTRFRAETIERMVALETALENRFNTFRAELDGKRASENEIRAILEKSDDVDLRRRAWEASKQVGREVEPELRELARVRNAAARDLGWSSFYSMSLELDELDETEVFSILDRVVAGSQARGRSTSARSTSARRPDSGSRSTSCGRGTTPTRSSRRLRPKAWISTAGSRAASIEALVDRLLRRRRLRRPADPRALRPLREGRQVPARLLRGHRPERRHPRPRQPGADGVLGGDDAARARPCGLRRRHRPVAPVLPADVGAHDRHGGLSDAVRPPLARGRVADALRRDAGGRGPRSRRGSGGGASPSTCTSRAGFR